MKNNNESLMISTGSIIVADTSGQTIQKPYIRQEKNRVYITDDNKYIVVDEIKFEIYRPEHGVTIGPQESWYDVDSWVISQKDFDTVKALTGIGGALLGIGDITLPEQGEIFTEMGKVKNLESLIKKPFIIWEVIDEKKGTITFSNFFINRDDFLYKDKTSFTSKYYRLGWNIQMVKSAILDFSYYSCIYYIYCFLFRK